MPSYLFVFFFTFSQPTFLVCTINIFTMCTFRCGDCFGYVLTFDFFFFRLLLTVCPTLQISKMRVPHSLCLLALALAATLVAPTATTSAATASSTLYPECDALPNTQQLSCRLLRWGVVNGVLTAEQQRSLSEHLPAVIAELPASAASAASAAAAGTSEESFIGAWFRRVRAGFSVMNILYGIGGTIVVLSMTFLLARAYQTMGGSGLAVCLGCVACVHVHRIDPAADLCLHLRCV
jgi:hypothetical protein